MSKDPRDDMPTRRPFDLDKASAAKDISDYLNHYIGVMDSKATAFLAGSVGAATFLLQKVPEGGVMRVLYVVAVVLFGASIFVAGGVIFPRVPRRGASILFWGDIARQPSYQSYLQEFDRVVESGFLDEQYCAQNFQSARLLRRKFLWLRWSIILFGCALFTAFSVYVCV